MQKVARLTFTLTIFSILLFGIFLGCNSDESTNEKSANFKDIASLAQSFPDSIPLQIEYYRDMFTRGDQKVAMEGLMKLAEKNPERTDLLNRLAELAVQYQDTVLSIHYLNLSIAANPNQSDAPFMLASIYAKQKNPTWERIAVKLIEKKEDPIAVAKGYFLLGLDLSNQNKIDDAIKAFDKAIIQHFTFTDAYIEKAILLYEINKIDQAIDVLYKAMELDRKSADISFWLGECHLKRKDFMKAKAFYEQTLVIDPNYGLAADRIAEINH